MGGCLIIEGFMYKNRFNGRNNVAGVNIARIRKSKVPRMSQRALAEALQLIDHDVDKNAVQKMESGERFINDIELCAIAKVLDVSYEELLAGGVYSDSLEENDMTGMAAEDSGSYS